MAVSKSSRSAPAANRAGIAETRTHLNRLDRRDWFRWATTVAVCLLLTAGVFSLALPTLRRNWLDQSNLDISVMGLIALVLLFAAYAAYQQLQITRLRRELTMQVGMDATFEVLKPAPAAYHAAPYPVREHTRFHVDLRVSIEAHIRGKNITVIGRTCDLSEGGVGIVIPESLVPGDPVVVQLPIGNAGENTAIEAIVRHQRGFYHGCEFVGLRDWEREAIRASCAGALPVRDYRHDPRAAVSV